MHSYKHRTKNDSASGMGERVPARKTVFVNIMQSYPDCRLSVALPAANRHSNSASQFFMNI